MTIARPILSFAVCHVPGAPNAVRLLRMTDDAQERITVMIEEQLDYLVGENLMRVPFDPTYTTDDESVLWIKGFGLPDHIEEAIALPKEVPSFSASEEIDRIKFIFHADSNENLFFQCWRNFEVLNRGKIWFLLSRDTFVTEEEGKVPLVLERRLDAVFWDGDLFFKSYANTSAMLAMLDYVSEATAEDIEAFATIGLFEGNPKELGERCSRLHLKHIRLLIQSGILRDQNVTDLYNKAHEVDYELPMSKDGHIVLPSRSRDLTALLKFLSDRIYRGIITGHTYVATSSTRK
jgi:hypothetical protein